MKTPKLKLVTVPYKHTVNGIGFNLDDPRNRAANELLKAVPRLEKKFGVTMFVTIDFE